MQPNALIDNTQLQEVPGGLVTDQLTQILNENFAGLHNSEYGFFAATAATVNQGDDLAWASDFKSSGITEAAGVITLPINTGVYEVRASISTDSAVVPNDNVEFALVDTLDVALANSVSTILSDVSIDSNSGANDAVAFVDTAGVAPTVKLTVLVAAGALDIKAGTNLTIKRVG